MLHVVHVTYMSHRHSLETMNEKGKKGGGKVGRKVTMYFGWEG